MVSVIIATYRRDQSLFNALNSLLSQTYHDFEVVLVDDNADNEWNEKVKTIVSFFCTKLQIRYIQNEYNQGSAKTRNIGIMESKGEYITFLDDDDLYQPNKIEVQVNQMRSEEADYSLMNLALYNDDESLSEIRKRDYLLTDESNDLILCHLKYHMTGTDTMMFRKKYLTSFGGFEAIDVGDEFYLMMKAIKAGGRFVYCNSCEVKAYVHTGEGGLSSGMKKIEGEKKLYAYKKTFFKGISSSNKRFIKMRHYAVIAFAHLRLNHYILFIWNGCLSFIISPKNCISLLRGRKE
jgi:glycosyltransferase involved in cell wall biosynthesis